MKSPNALLLTTALITLSSAPAFADAKDDKIAAMEQQMLLMMEEIKTMKADRAAEKTQQAATQNAIKQQVTALEVKTDEAVANIAPRTLFL